MSISSEILSMENFYNKIISCLFKFFNCDNINYTSLILVEMGRKNQNCRILRSLKVTLDGELLEINLDAHERLGTNDELNQISHTNNDNNDNNYNEQVNNQNHNNS